MSLRQDDHTSRDENDAQERRAAALVNPSSGLASDFLNVYNEVLMLIEMLPTMPELADDLFAWRPCSYRAYFMQSNLPGRGEALETYARLEPSFRALFETSVELLAECGVAAIRAIMNVVALGKSDDNELLADICADWCANIRRQLDATEQLVTWGHVAKRRCRQDMINDLFSAA